MTTLRQNRIGAFLVGLVVLAPGALAGQSLLGTRGLGLPLEALDARSRALGSEGVGLMGGNLNPSDLASATGLFIPTVNFTLQPYWQSGSLDGESVNSQGTRFPLLGLAYPIGAWNGMVTVTFGSFMDQRWEIQESGTEELAGIPTPVTNTFKSNGGISVFRLGWAQRLGSSLSVAVSGGLHTGSVTRTYIRTFDSLAIASAQILPFTDGGKWRYSGPTGTLAAVWDPLELLRLGGSVTWSGDLEATPVSGTGGEGALYSIPSVFRLGASGVLTPRLSVNLGLSFADWASSENGLNPETVAGGVWSFGGGLQWEASGLGERTLPIRLGMRRADLPFKFGDDNPTETVFSGGLGLNLTQAEDFVLAGIDFSVERGSRTAGVLEETFWRGTATVRVSGW